MFTHHMTRNLDVSSLHTLTDSKQCQSKSQRSFFFCTNCQVNLKFYMELQMNLI